MFPFARFPGVDILLGPEMKSTGEVMGSDADFGRAFAKSQIGAGQLIPVKGTVFISVKDADKPAMVVLGQRLAAMGFELIATGGTARALVAAGLVVRRVNKVMEGRPHIVDAMKSGEVHLVFNTVDSAGAVADSAAPAPHRRRQPDSVLHNRRGCPGDGRGDRRAPCRNP